MIRKETIDTIKNTYKEEKYKINPVAYFYDLSIIKDNISNLKSYMPNNISLYYAMKANTNKYILECIAKDSYIKGF